MHCISMSSKFNVYMMITNLPVFFDPFRKETRREYIGKGRHGRNPSSFSHFTRALQDDTGISSWIVIKIIQDMIMLIRTEAE